MVRKDYVGERPARPMMGPMVEERRRHLRLVADDELPDPDGVCPRLQQAEDRLAALHLAARRGVGVILDGLDAADRHV